MRDLTRQVQICLVSSGEISDEENFILNTRYQSILQDRLQ
jgi:hypothetical protein